MNYNKLFILFCFGIIFGIFIGNIIFNFRQMIIFLSIISFLFFVGIFILKSKIKSGFFFYLGYLLITFYYGYYMTNIKTNLDNLELFENKNVEITGVVKNLYDKTDFNNQYLIELDNIDGNYLGKKINFLIGLPTNQIIDYNTKITFSGKFEIINNFSNFNYKNFMLSKNIYFKINYSFGLEYFKQEENIIGKIDKFKLNFISKINDFLPENEANLLAGILIGYRENFDADLLNSYNNSGLTHLIAVSGFNISIIIIFFSFLLSRLPFFLKPLIIIPFIIFFVILVGNNPPVLRAGIMGIIGYMILIFGRENNFLSTICIALVGMLIFSPLSLNFDSSFILSFLAVFGIFYLGDFYKKVFSRVPKLFGIKESLILTFSALSTTFPILLFGFGKISLITPLSNLIVGGIIPFAMLFGFLGTILYSLNNFLGYYFGFIPYLLLNFINNSAVFFGKFSVSIIEYDFGKYSGFLEIGYLFILFSLVIYFQNKKNKTSN